ncbi:MAG: hypothetical protein ACQZ3N_03335 [cyanobacterium endosymbiont of Rhopalodia yunnanensis]
MVRREVTWALRSSVLFRGVIRTVVCVDIGAINHFLQSKKLALVDAGKITNIQFIEIQE